MGKAVENKPTLSSNTDPGNFQLRTNLQPGDLGWIVTQHGLLYAQEFGFDHTFEAYVAGPLADCVRAKDPRDRIWIAERDGEKAGCIAIVGTSSPEEGQLRWYLVHPSHRGHGLGKRLLHQALAFAKTQGFKTILLWTVSQLTAAALLYKSVGFRKVEEQPGNLWGMDLIEEKYVLNLQP